MIINETTKANAQAVLDYLEAHPEKHSQNHWFGYMGDDIEDAADYNATKCGTTMCIAGTAAWIEAGQPKVLIVDNLDVEKVGSKFLGLEDYEERDHIFYNYSESNSLDMLRALANGDEDKFWAIDQIDDPGN